MLPKVSIRTTNSNCITCKGLIEKLNKAKAENDPESARIAYDQMREHRLKVKYPAKHGFPFH